MTYSIFHLFLSLSVFYGLSFAVSENRKIINVKMVIRGIILQIIFALLLIKISHISLFLEKIALGFSVMIKATEAAGSVLFGQLAKSDSEWGYILAIQGFPVLIIVGALSGLLSYWGILPMVVRSISTVFREIFNIGGVLGIASSVNLFSGMHETPLIVRSYLRHLTHSELFSIMCCGAASISTSMIALYPTVLGGVVANPIVHVINSALISIPGALTISRIVIPENKISQITEAKDIEFCTAKSVLEAVSDGAINGGKVVIRIVAMVIGFVALIFIFNQILSLIEQDLTLQKILGIIAAPLAWIIGISWEEAHIVGSLWGTKTALNEIVAFADLRAVGDQMSDKAKIASLYLVSNFANLGSVAGMTGVYTGLVPERKDEVISLAFKAMLVGNIVSYITAAIVVFLV